MLTIARLLVRCANIVLLRASVVMLKMSNRLARTQDTLDEAARKKERERWKLK